MKNSFFVKIITQFKALMGKIMTTTATIPLYNNKITNHVIKLK